MRGGSPEPSLLVECLLAAAGPRPGLSALAGRARPAAFVALARRVAVSETAAHALLAAGALDALGRDAAAALRADGELAAARNALLVTEAAALQRALASAGVESVALKGTALVALHYPAIGARHVSDLDLLVHPSEVARASAVVRELGCRPACPLPAHDGRPARAERTGHHLAPLLTPGGILCELHHALPCARGREVAPSGVITRAREVPWRAGLLRVPSPDDLLGIACAHVLGAHRGDPRFLPRHLADVAVLLASGADPDRAGRLHPGPELAESMALVAAARSGCAAPLFALGAAAVAARGRGALADAAAARRRGELGRFLFPARAFLSARYGFAPTSPWLPLLWAWRPVRAALRVVTGR